MRPSSFWSMSVQERLCAVDGFAEFHGSKKETDAELLADIYATDEALKGA